jgi:hypothetical protein
LGVPFTDGISIKHSISYDTESAPGNPPQPKAKLDSTIS